MATRYFDPACAEDRGPGDRGPEDRGPGDWGTGNGATMGRGAAGGETGAARGAARAGLPAGRLAAFASLSIPLYAAQMPLGVYLPTLYAQFPGLSLTLIGAIFLAERVWGTLADPLVGLLSDRTSSRFGARRAWIVAGAALYALSGAALFFPPAQVGVAYLAGALFAFYLGGSMIQIPYLAWSGEISGGYHERTRVATYVSVAGATALLLVLILPTVIDQWRPHDGALKLAVMGGVILSSLAVSLPLALRAFPDRSGAGPVRRRPGGSLFATLGPLARDRLLVRVLVSDFAVRTGQSIRSALIVFFVTFYMGAPQWASGLFLLQFLFGIAAGPIWMRIGRRIGKRRAAVTGELVQVAINLGLLLVTPDRFGLLVALTVAQGFAQGSGNLMLRAMVADVADKHRLETGENRSGLFFSAFSLSEKAGTALAIGLALPLVAWAGFDPRLARNAPGALEALLWAFALGPALAHLVSAAVIRGFTLDEGEHDRIRQALEARESAARSAEYPPATTSTGE